MAAAGAGGGVPPPVQDPLQLVDYDVPELAPPPAGVTDNVAALKAQGPWYRIRPETAVVGETYVSFRNEAYLPVSFVKKVSRSYTLQNPINGLLYHFTAFKVINGPNFTQGVSYDPAGNLLMDTNVIAIYALKKPVPAEVVAGPRGQQYREALVQAFGPVDAIVQLKSNIRTNAKERRLHAVDHRMSQGGGRQKTRKQRGGNKFMEFLQAGKAGALQGLRNAPKATFAQLRSSFKNKGSNYSSPNSIISMRGSNINEELANLNAQFVKEAGATIRPYTMALRQAVKNKYNSIMGPRGTIPKMTANFTNSWKRQQLARNFKKRANNFSHKFTPRQNLLPEVSEAVGEAIPELM